jgi:DNA-binding NtrC family response regulator
MDTSMKKRVLLIDDEARVRASLKAVLEPTYETIQAADAQEGLELFRKEAPHLVLLDVILPGTDGLSVLQTMRAEDRTAPVIMLTGTKSVKTAVDAMKFGAADYLSKPFDVEELRIIVERALNDQELQQEVKQLRAQVVRRYAFHNLIGKSPSMQDIYTKIEQVADSRTTVLIAGESGTGKELVAKALHYNSGRRERPFIALNCAALPETLIESELFGHEKGSFTDATARRVGQFELANTGTLFLDRDRRPQRHDASQAAARLARTRIHQSRRCAIHQSGCAHCDGDEPESRGTRSQGAIPRRPLLPYQRHCAVFAPAPGAW